MPALKVLGVARFGIPPDQDGETGHIQRGIERLAKPCAVQPSHFTGQLQPSEHDGNTDGGRQQTTRHTAAFGLAGDHRHQAALRTHTEDPQRKQGKKQRRMNRHFCRTGHGQVLRIVGIADQGHQPGQADQEGDAMGRPMAVPGLHFQQEERSPQEEKIQRRDGCHPAGMGRFQRTGPVRKEQLVNLQIPAEQMLAEREQSDEGAGCRAPLAKVPGVWRGLFGPGHPQRHARQYKSERGVGLHGDPDRQDAFQGGHVEEPAHEDRASHEDGRAAGELRKAPEGRDQDGLGLITHGTTSNKPRGSSILLLSHVSPAEAGLGAGSGRGEGAPPGDGASG